LRLAQALLRLAWKRSFPADTQRWVKERDRIYRAIMSRSWNEREGAFTQSFDSDALDSSTLLMPLMLFVSPVDPRMVATIERIRQQLAHHRLSRRARRQRTLGIKLARRPGRAPIPGSISTSCRS